MLWLYIDKSRLQGILQSLVTVIIRRTLYHEISVYPYRLGYPKDSNAAAHSVDSDTFYADINLFALFKSYIITFIS